LDEGIDRLEYFKNVKDVMVVVGGGDGTMGGLVDPIHAMLGKDVNLIPFPLGTGNDLSRAMGWGEGIKSVYDVKYFLKGLENKPMKTRLDRWRIRITSRANPAKVLLDEKMLLYFGIGLDAKFSYRFNNIRKKYPVFFKSTVPTASSVLQQVLLQPNWHPQPLH
jgi:diacylglycerol kinase (ATP)